LAVIVGKSCKKIYIFCLTNILEAITLPPALAFGVFNVKSVRRSHDMNQFSFQTVYLGTNGLAIALLSAGTVFLI